MAALRVDAQLASPPGSEGLPSPLSMTSDGTGPLLSEDMPSLSSGEHSDWSDPEDVGDEDEYDLIASQDFSVISATSATNSSASEARSSVPSEQDEHMRLSFPDPLTETDILRREGEEGSSQGSLDQSSSEGSDDEENDVVDDSDVDYSLLLDAPSTSKAPAQVAVVSSLPRPEASYTNGYNDDDVEVTPKHSEIIERSVVDKVSNVNADDVARSADIAAWVRLTGDATTLKAAQRASPLTPPLLTPTSDGAASPSSFIDPRERERPSKKLAKSALFRESERQQPSSAAKLTNPTPKETKEAAECIKHKLEQLAAITHASVSSSASPGDRKHSSASKVTLALTAAAILVAAAAALVDPSSLSLSRSLDHFLSEYNTSPAVSSTVLPSSSITTPVIVASTASVQPTTPDVPRPVVQEPVEVVASTTNQGLPETASSCSLSNPGGCALSLIDTRTALTVFAVDAFALRPSLFGGSGRSNSSPTASTSAATLDDLAPQTRGRRQRREKRGQGCRARLCTSTNRKACRRSGRRHRRAIGFTESVRTSAFGSPSKAGENPTLHEAFLTISAASRRAVHRAQNEVVKFREGQLALAVRGGKRLRYKVQQQSKRAVDEAKRGIDEARKVARAEGRKRIVEARKEARRLLKEVEATLGDSMTKGRQEVKYRVVRAAKGYGRLRRGEVKFQHGKLVLQRSQSN